MVKMMNFNNDIDEILKLNLPWEIFNDKKILITGGTGLIGSIIVNTLLRLNCKIYVVCRNVERAKEMFNTQNVYIIKHDINEPLCIDEHFDFILHFCLVVQVFFT